MFADSVAFFFDDSPLYRAEVHGAVARVFKVVANDRDPRPTRRRAARWFQPGDLDAFRGRILLAFVSLCRAIGVSRDESVVVGDPGGETQFDRRDFLLDLAIDRPTLGVVCQQL